MTPNSPAEVSRYTEQERGHWRFVGQGLGWTTLGVFLSALAIVILLVMSITMFSITAPRNPGAMRMGGGPGTEVLTVVFTFLGFSCTLLGFLATMIGLALCCFAPRPPLAKFLALAALILFVLSHASVGRSLLTQFNINQRIPGGGAVYGSEVFSFYFIAFSEYLLSIILGCCYLLAVADEFNDRETIRGTQTYLKMLFGIPAILLALGLITTLLASGSNQAASWLPIVLIALVAVAYGWMSFCLIKLLGQLKQKIRAETDPFYRPPSQAPLSKPVVIDPLAD